jgi:hypothetical protein
MDHPMSIDNLTDLRAALLMECARIEEHLELLDEQDADLGHK